MLLQVLVIFLNVFNFATAYPGYRSQIPNGVNVPDPCQPNGTWPGVGHQAKQGSGVRNPFGLDFANNGHIWTPALCRLDSDGDGRTNGQELGDPDCTWSAAGGGSQNITSAGLSHPGICEPISSANCLALNQWLSCKSFSCPAWSLNTTRNVSLTFPPSPVPVEVTSYMCVGFALPNDSVFHIVGFRPVINNTNVIHHIILYGCPNGMDASNSLTSPTTCGMSLPSCQTVLAVWSVGMAGQCFSDQFGLPMGQLGVQYAVLQVHWNNPKLLQNQFDTSGLMLFYTDQLRPNNGQIVKVGQFFLNIPPGRESVVATGSCLRECTIFMPYNVSIAAGFLHMHLLGKSGNVQLISDGKLETILDGAHYDYNSPTVISYEEPIPLFPGDEIRVNCEFDSRDRNATTNYGEATTDEMCIAFVTIYPAINNFDRCYTWKDLNSGCPISPLQPYPRCNFDNFKGLIALAAAKCDANCSEPCRGLADSIFKTGCLDNPVGDYLTTFISRLNAKLPSVLNIVQNVCEIVN